MQKIILWLTTRLFFPVLVVAAFSYNCLASDTTPPIYVEPPQLGIPLKLPQQIEINTTQFLEQYSIPADRTGDWSVDIGNRQASRALYNSVYLASESIPDGWTGDVDPAPKALPVLNLKMVYWYGSTISGKWRECHLI